MFNLFNNYERVQPHLTIAELLNPSVRNMENERHVIRVAHMAASLHGSKPTEPYTNYFVTPYWRGEHVELRVHDAEDTTTIGTLTIDGFLLPDGRVANTGKEFIRTVIQHITAKNSR